MTITSYNNEKVEERAEAIEKLMDLRDAAAVTTTVHTLGFRWFLLEPGSQVKWPEEIANHPAFELGGYRLYRF
jgi:hypothetical protein